VDNIVTISQYSTKPLGVHVLLAHNFTLNLEAGGSTSTTYCSAEPCLLYSGAICQVRKQVAAGTVFRTVLIWALNGGHLLHRLSGH
jgi:hypothetical protein